MARIIDGDKLLKVLLEHWNIPRDYDGSLADDVEEIISIIDNFPTIEPVKGKWVSLHGIIHCSNCNSATGVPTCYCSDCGADMREDKDE